MYPALSDSASVILRVMGCYVHSLVIFASMFAIIVPLLVLSFLALAGETKSLLSMPDILKPDYEFWSSCLLCLILCFVLLVAKSGGLN